MPSRRALLGGCAGLAASLAGCSLLPPYGGEPHRTRNWLYDPVRFSPDWARYTVSNRTPALWADHRQWLGDAVDAALDPLRSYYDRFGVDATTVYWHLRVGDPRRALPRLRVSASAFDRPALEAAVAAFADPLDDYETLSTYRGADGERALAVGGDYLVDCRAEDPPDALRTCVDTQTGALDRFTATSERCERLADAVVGDAGFGFEVPAAPEGPVVGRGWQRHLNDETTELTGVVLFADGEPVDEAAVREVVSLPDRREDRSVSVRVDGRLGTVTASRPTRTVRLDAPPFRFD
jgi:hypothetical protein